MGPPTGHFSRKYGPRVEAGHPLTHINQAPNDPKLDDGWHVGRKPAGMSQFFWKLTGPEHWHTGCNSGSDFIVAALRQIKTIASASPT